MILSTFDVLLFLLLMNRTETDIRCYLLFSTLIVDVLWIDNFFFFKSLWFVNVLSWWLFVVIKINVIRIKLRLLIKSLVKDAIKHVIIEFLILICLFCFQKMKSNFMHKTFECFFSSRFYLAPYNVTIYLSFTHVYHNIDWP